MSDETNDAPKPKTLQLPAPEGIERVETGPIRFYGDWTGYFIRGDDAFALGGDAVTCLRFLERTEEYKALDWYSQAWLTTAPRFLMKLRGAYEGEETRPEPAEACLWVKADELRAMLDENDRLKAELAAATARKMDLARQSFRWLVGQYQSQKKCALHVALSVIATLYPSLCNDAGGLPDPDTGKWPEETGRKTGDSHETD